MSFSEGIDSAKTARSGQMLIIGDEALQEMTAHAEGGYPHEVCGLLLGEVDAASSLRRVRQAKRARNLDLERANNRYELDPTDYLRIDAQARQRGLSVVGVYHSHPEHPARPSETDQVGAAENPGRVRHGGGVPRDRGTQTAQQSTRHRPGNP